MHSKWLGLWRGAEWSKACAYGPHGLSSPRFESHIGSFAEVRGFYPGIRFSSPSTN